MPGRWTIYWSLVSTVGLIGMVVTAWISPALMAGFLGLMLLGWWVA